MHLSIVIPTWKRLSKLKACLKSLEDQLTLPDQVIITARHDDLDTVSYISEIKISTKLKIELLLVYQPGVIHAENAAINYILSRNETEIITFMDDDAVAFNDWISKIKFFFISFPAAALGGPDIISTEPNSYFDFEVQDVGLITFYGKVIGNHHKKSHGIRTVDVLKGVNMSVRINYLSTLENNLQGADPAKGNGVFWELDLCFKIKNQGGKIYFDPSLLINHNSDHSHFIKNTVISSTSHNLAYVMMNHLTPTKKIIFSLYSLLIGNSHIQGIMKTFVECFKARSPSPFISWRYSMFGFFSGMYLYFINIQKRSLK